jgi:hypothetical protein
MAIHSVELWLKGLAAAIAGAAMPKTTPRPGRLSVSQPEVNNADIQALCQVSHQERVWIPHRHCAIGNSFSIRALSYSVEAIDMYFRGIVPTMPYWM